MLPVAASLLGGNTNNHAGRDQRQATSFANRSAILDKVAATKEAGISPLYALGAPTISVQSAVGTSSSGGSLGSSLSAMGQDVSRALAAGQSGPERELQALALQKAALENEYLRAQITSVNARTARESAPPLPSPVSARDINLPAFPGSRLSIRPEPGTSSSQRVQDEYGDVAENLYGLWHLGTDVAKNIYDWARSSSSLDRSGPGGSWRKTWDYIWN